VGERKDNASSSLKANSGSSPGERNGRQMMDPRKKRAVGEKVEYSGEP